MDDNNQPFSQDMAFGQTNLYILVVNVLLAVHMVVNHCKFKTGIQVSPDVSDKKDGLHFSKGY